MQGKPRNTQGETGTYIGETDGREREEGGNGGGREGRGEERRGEGTNGG